MRSNGNFFHVPALLPPPLIPQSSQPFRWPKLYPMRRSLKLIGNFDQLASPAIESFEQPTDNVIFFSLFAGWFSLVRERSLQTRAKVYSSVQQLVSARVAVFLSKSSLTGFKLAPSSGEYELIPVIRSM